MKKYILSYLIFLNLQFCVLSQIKITQNERSNLFKETESISNSQRIKSINSQLATIPYPIIFIHGLAGNGFSSTASDGTWEVMRTLLTSQYGLEWGGRIDYCLNSDNNTTKAIVKNDVLSFTNDTALLVGDFYMINFNVNTDGTLPISSDKIENTASLSNQSAITKQGIALNDAITKVINKTGRKKVILFGHSMGGLCAREYMQNKSIWADSTDHKIAQLITTGTPHGGSNSSTSILSNLNIKDINENSEAVRDLRRSYFYSGNSGVYLYGGIESLRGMNDNFCCFFHNADVNCNGITGETIIGLNQKKIINTIPYSCIIGDCSGCYLAGSSSSDGVVRVTDANLNTFYNLSANVFTHYESAAIQIHTNLPKQSYENMQGMDEPNVINQAFEIEQNKSYIGFSTIQSSYVNIMDIDNFFFINQDGGDYKFNLSNMKNVKTKIINEKSTESFVLTNSNEITKDTVIKLSKGKYYIEFESNSLVNNYKTPYKFSFVRESNTDLFEKNVNKFELKTLIYPNPAENFVFILLDEDQLKYIKKIKFIDLYSSERILVKEINSEMNIDLTLIPSSIYIIQYFNENNQLIKSEKLIKK